MSRKLFTTGCVVLIALGLVHLLGHYMMTTSQGQTEADRQLLAMMRGNPQDMGLGMMRSMFDLVTGFSLTFSVLPIGMGLAGLRRPAPRACRTRPAAAGGDRLRRHVRGDDRGGAALLVPGPARLHRRRLLVLRVGRGDRPTDLRARNA